MIKIAVNFLGRRQAFGSSRTALARIVCRAARAALRREKKKNGIVSITLTDDQAMKRFNRQYRKIPYPTDVLSFSQDGEDGLLGDILISVPTARRQAGKFLYREIALLAIHGCLHLLGYDHKLKYQQAIMWRKQELILEGLKV